MFIKKKPFHVFENNLELKQFFFIDETDIQQYYLKNKTTSYNAFIITKDKKILCCERQDSFYWTYLVQKFNNYNFYLYKKILNIVKSLLLEEFLAFYIYFYHDKDMSKLIFLRYKSIINSQFCNIEKIKEKILLLKKSNINFEYINQTYGSELKTIFNEFLNYQLPLNLHQNLILPGGRKNHEDLNFFNILKREIKEELNINVDEAEIKILNNNYEFCNYNIKSDIEPFYIYIRIYDKILNTYFDNICVIVNLNINFSDIKFILNKEIKKLFYINYNINKNFDKKKFILFLNKFNSFFNNG